ncbi:MAG TPA: hypothetical protein VG934_01930 [Candidatus Paceibacterota bacterium]|nr:hypothetical protein [Candidatus Paceibacterota bacterium]
MSRISGPTKRLLAIGSKAVVAFTLLVVVFSPVGQLLQTPWVEAAGCPDGSRADQGYGGAYPCYNQTTEAEVGYVDQKGTFVPTDAQGHPTSGDNTGAAFCNDFGNCLAQIVYVFTAGLGGWVAGIASFIFNTTVQLSLSSTAYAQGFLSQGWATSRDLANMFFILILVYIAVTVVLKADTHGTIQSLVWVIFIALIINFSFFFTRVVIDAGNFAAVQFYDAIQVPKAADETTASQAVTATTGKKDLAAAIMQDLGVTNILSSNSFKAFQANNQDPSFLTEFITLSVIYLSTGIMLFVLAAGLAAAAIKFLMRVATLWIIIIVSPLALVASAMPPVRKYFDQWRDALIANAFFPVAFLFIFWIITLFASGLNIQDTFDKLTASSPTAASSGIETLLNLIANITIRMGFVIALIFLGLRAADQVGIMGAQLANNWGNKLAFGGSAWVGRQTAGRAGLAATRSEGLRQWASESAVGAMVFRGAGALSRGSFDVRSLPGAGNLKGQLGEAGGKGGIAASVDKKDKAREKAIHDFGESLKPDIKDQNRIQQEHIESVGGRAEFNALVESLTRDMNRTKAEAESNRDKAKVETDEAEKKRLNQEATVAENRVKALQKEIKGHVEHGKKEADDIGKERTHELAERLASNTDFWTSRGTLKGIASLTHHETKEQKLAKAAKDLIDGDEHGTTDNHDEEHSPATTPTKSAPTPSKTGPANDNHAPAANDNHGGDHGH